MSWEALNSVLFYAAAAIAVASAIVVVAQRNPVYSAFALIVTLCSLSAIYGLLGSPFIATTEARASDAYKQMIVDSNASDIVYSNYFTGIHGNYLKPSIFAAGMDPENLPEADPSKMDFETATTGAKAWKDIWGCGQGIGAVTEIAPVATLVDRLAGEYEQARRRLAL